MSTNEQWLSTIICYVQHIMSAYYAWAKSSSLDYVSILYMYSMNSDWAQSSTVLYNVFCQHVCMISDWAQSCSLEYVSIYVWTVIEHNHLLSIMLAYIYSMYEPWLSTNISYILCQHNVLCMITNICTQFMSAYCKVLYSTWAQTSAHM